MTRCDLIGIVVKNCETEDLPKPRPEFLAYVVDWLDREIAAERIERNYRTLFHRRLDPCGAGVDTARHEQQGQQTELVVVTRGVGGWLVCNALKNQQPISAAR